LRGFLFSADALDETPDVLVSEGNAVWRRGKSGTSGSALTRFEGELEFVALD